MNRRQPHVMRASLQARLHHAQTSGEEIVLVETWELAALLTGDTSKQADKDDQTTRLSAGQRAFWELVNACERETTDYEFTQEASE